MWTRCDGRECVRSRCRSHADITHHVHASVRVVFILTLGSFGRFILVANAAAVAARLVVLAKVGIVVLSDVRVVVIVHVGEAAIVVGGNDADTIHGRRGTGPVRIMACDRSVVFSDAGERARLSGKMMKRPERGIGSVRVAACGRCVVVGDTGAQAWLWSRVTARPQLRQGCARSQVSATVGRGCLA